MITLLLALQAGWTPIPPDFKGTLEEMRAPKWSFLAAPDALEHASLKAELTILEAAKHHGYFDQHWSVWPDLTYSDGPWEAGFLLRGGYRVQLSHALQEIALVKVPDGGYLRVVPCALALGTSVAVKVDIQGPTIAVAVDGVEKIRYVDRLRPLGPGRFGVGANGGGQAKFANVALEKLPDAKPAEAVAHVPSFSRRKWLGGRQWVFDGQEPILMLPAAEQTYINNVKLRPGWKPLLSWNSHWDVQTQGAFKEADNKLESVDGLQWTFRHVKNQFVVRTSMELGWDARRETYTYDIQSELEVLEQFHFRYGYDFEHHTPLDPFRWQYLVLRREGGRVERRPVYPIDPGGMDAIAQTGGARVWYGRHADDLVVAPAVEYDLPASKRKMSTAVCAAFYDTGVALGAETAPAGTKVKVKYRYTGWPAAEAKELFEASTPHRSPMLDPDHHYIFADDGLKVTFGQAVPMTETWIYGRRPFMSGHNQRPTYAWVKDVGMKCGPGAYGKALFPAPPGRYAARARVKADNVHGPGGRIEVGKTVHYVGAGSFDWKEVEFAVDVPADKEFSLAFGNAGTGDVYFGSFELKPGEAPPANPKPSAVEPAPPGAIADYRMEEQKGQHVFDYARGPIGTLELANLAWVVDEGRPALRFAPSSTSTYPKAGFLDRGYLGTSGYAERRSVPAALAGHHGGGDNVKGLTVVAWIKPDAKLPTNRGDIVGLGARRYILGLSGGAAPYRLEARINVNDVFTSKPVIEAGKWQKVSMTCAPEAGQWRVKLHADDRLLQEGLTKKFPSPASIPPSLVLGTELFYFHDCYYRGLLGRVTVLAE